MGNQESPDRVECPNLISLNKARKLYKEGKAFLPDFNDFIDGYNFYGEMEFTYKRNIWTDGKCKWRRWVLGNEYRYVWGAR